MSVQLFVDIPGRTIIAGCTIFPGSGGKEEEKRKPSNFVLCV